MSTSTQPTSPTAARSRRPPLRSIAAATLFFLIAIACAQPDLLKLPFIDREPLARQMLMTPDAGGWFPRYPAFLEEVADHTQRGDTIALVVPPKTWDGGYSYAYYRASYFLAGREVLPVVDADDRALPENLQRARYVAVWRMPPPAGWRVAWAAHGGALLAR